MERAAVTAREMLSMDMAFVSETRNGEQRFVCVTGDADSFDIAAGTSVPMEGTYCRLMLEDRLPNIVRDTAAEPAVRDLPATAGADIGSYIGVPVVLEGGEVYGTFCCVSHDTKSSLRDRDVRFLQVLAQLVADHVDDQRRERERHRAELTTGNVHALLAALQARDGYTEEHSAEVVQLALSVGRRLGLAGDELTDLEYAALLHDIGKIGVPDAVLRKPAPLDENDWVLMKEHPAIGERIVSAMPSLAHLAPTIRAEHERWDGRGYPDGLAGEEIPLAAQIVLACDAFHAMTSDRPYRAAMPVPQAIAEIEANAGSQFAPRAAGATVEVVHELTEGRFSRDEDVSGSPHAGISPRRAARTPR